MRVGAASLTVTASTGYAKLQLETTFGGILSSYMTRSRFALATAAFTVAAGCRAYAPTGSLAASDPALARGIATADSLIDASLGRLIPGAVFLVARDGRLVHERAFGYAQLNDYEMHRLASPRAMRTSTMFDLASVTKVMATTFAIMLLADRGQIDVEAPVSRYLPEFRGAHLDSITVRHLLTHSSGLVQWQPSTITLRTAPRRTA